MNVRESVVVNRERPLEKLYVARDGVYRGLVGRGPIVDRGLSSVDPFHPNQKFPYFA